MVCLASPPTPEENGKREELTFLSPYTPPPGAGQGELFLGQSQAGLFFRKTLKFKPVSLWIGSFLKYFLFCIGGAS